MLRVEALALAEARTIALGLLNTTRKSQLMSPGAQDPRFSPIVRIAMQDPITEDELRRERIIARVEPGHVVRFSPHFWTDVFVDRGDFFPGALPNADS